MKILIIVLPISFLWTSLSAQPESFNWRNRHNNFDYIRDNDKEQGEQGPCSIFATVAAI